MMWFLELAVRWSFPRKREPITRGVEVTAHESPLARGRRKFSLVATVALLAVTLAHAQETTAPRPRLQPVLAPHGMVTAQESRATRIGVDVLEKGGNAVDAAVAVGFALAVTHPQAGPLGGGGFMVIHLAERNESVAIDYRETAPQAVTPDIFLDDKGEADPEKSRNSALAIGVPGTVAGLTLAHARYGSGRFTLADLLAPAIALARDGFPVEDDLADTLPRLRGRLARWPAAAKIFLRPDGTPLGPGETLVQQDLAAVLAGIARDGPRAFYEGETAEKVAAGVRTAGGIMTADDLKAYRAIERPAVRGTYRGYDIVSMPPPSSGGTLLVELLNILEGFDLRRLGADTPHTMVEAMKLAYADRAHYLGDPDAVDVPVARLIAKDYAVRLRNEITEHARPAHSIRRGESPREGQNTTHFSVVDRSGNAVANTMTLNFTFGLGFVAEGTGVLFNNELDDFAAKPGAPNAYGLVGGTANAPGPGKRPLSSMTPTIVLKDGKVFLVTGSPGGSRIITTVLQVVTNVIDHNMNVARAVAAPRIHHQWLPDEVLVEQGVSPDVIDVLEGRGHRVVGRVPWGSANSIMVTPAGLAGGADPRTRGSLAAGH
jgi:gamma-glutamyltranspeptidase / glutathione hydrolase